MDKINGFLPLGNFNSFLVTVFLLNHKPHVDLLICNGVYKVHLMNA